MDGYAQIDIDIGIEMNIGKSIGIHEDKIPPA